MDQDQLEQLKNRILSWGKELGFQQLAVADADVSGHLQFVEKWLENGYHGSMSWMERNRDKRYQPDQLLPGTLRVITARMDYRPATSPEIPENQSDTALVSSYAHGRDYHKTLRARLTTLAKRINEDAPHQYRAFVDSAPVLERALAEQSGLGWIGKNTMLINKDAGSWFFLGELFTNIPLPVDNMSETDIGTDNPERKHCGTCTACLDDCPTSAIVSPWQVDARRCISYLTIEHDGSIEESLRPLIGNRIFGCDDCQVVCPWNKFSEASSEKDFQPRPAILEQPLAKLFGWSEEEFLSRTEGSPIRRIGYENWSRNIAIGLGNATACNSNIEALRSRLNDASGVVREHVQWALARLENNR
jgi:epoxyqueuosine reductase